MHYNKQLKGMTVHFRKVCYPCKNVICQAECTSKWNKTQPQLVLQGYSTGLDLFNDTIIIKK